MFSNKKRVLGLDVGASNIKVAYLEYGKNGPELLGTGLAGVIDGAISDAGVVEVELVASSIREAVLQCGAPKSVRQVVAGIPAKQLTVRTITLPRLEPEEIPEAAKWEVAEFLPYPVEEAVMDFSPLTNRSGSGQVDVLCVSARRSVVEGLVRAIEAAGLEPLALDGVPMALGRVLLGETAAESHESGPGADAVAIVDIGALSTEVSIFLGGEPRVSRAIPVAGQSFTAAIASALAVRADSAEQIKHREAEVREDVDPDSRRGSIDGACRVVAEELTQELQRSLDYFRAQNQWMPIGEIVLTGGGARLKGLAQYLGEAVGLRIKLGDPLASGLVKHGGKTPGQDGVSAVSLGLALWGVSEA